MILTRLMQMLLYVLTVALVMARFAKNGSAKAAAGTAHLAHEYATAAVRESKLRSAIAKRVRK